MRSLRSSLPWLTLLALTAALPAAAQELKSDEDKILYSLGSMLGGNVKSLALSPEEFAKVIQGFDDASLGKKPQIEMSEWGPKVSPFAQKRQADASAKLSAVEKETAKPFLEKAGKEPGAQTLPSGLIYKTLKEGSGPQPTAENTVKVHYEGHLIDGTVFDSSRKRGEPATFPLKGVIKCWTEGVARMKVGEKAQLVCPSDLAYGDRGHQPGIPPGATLIFEVELLSIETPPAPPPAPGAPAAAPAAPVAAVVASSSAAKSGCTEAGPATIAECLAAVAVLFALRRSRRRASL